MGVEVQNRHTRPTPTRQTSCVCGELEYEAVVAPGLPPLRWDPATPGRWLGFGPDHPGRRPQIEVGDRPRWQRLAALTMLDRHLYLPLERSLLDAEIAAAQIDVAYTYPRGEAVRESLTRLALDRARRAAPGIVRYLERFTVDGRRPPAPLDASLAAVAARYNLLLAEVRSVDEMEDDAELASVTEVWHRLSAVERAHVEPRLPAPTADSDPPRVGDSLLDPRQVPARVLKLGPTVDAAEFDVNVVRSRGRQALRVRVAAFWNDQSLDEVADLGIRLIDRRSGRTRSYGLFDQLGPRPSAPLEGAGNRFFEGVVVLPDSLVAEDVRVDAYTVIGEQPSLPAGPDELHRIRRATQFLSGWRALVADVRLSGIRAVPTVRLREIARRLRAGDDRGDGIGGPMWAGGPSLSHLQRLAGVGDRALTAMLRDGAAGHAARIPGDADGGAAALVASVSGPGDLLAAELAVAHQQSRPL